VTGRADRQDHLPERLLPALHWIRRYDREWLSGDLLAGATAAAVVIPQAMGYATVAGLPVEIGLYTCIFPMAAYAIFGGSRKLSFSTTSTIVALSGLALAATGVDESEAIATVATLTFLVGLALIVFRLLRLGWMVEAVSTAVIDGLKVGVGLTIIADQLPKLLGIPSVSGGFIDDVGNAVANLGDSSVMTVLLAGSTITALIFLKIWAPRVPGPLLAVMASIAIVAIFGVSGWELIPEVPTGLPAPAIPGIDHLDVLLPYALAIALMAYFESITAARIARDSTDPPLDNDQEYVAVGVSTLVGSLFQTVPPAGGFSQTQVNASAGARTQASQLVTVGLAIVVALFLAPLLSDMPQATLGAIVTVSVLGLIDFTALSRLWRIDRLELYLAVVTAAAALLVNLLVGVLVGVILTLYFVLRALNHPVVVELRRPHPTGLLYPARPDDAAVPGMLILRIEGGLYTLNIRRALDEIWDRFEATSPTPLVLLIDVGGTADTSVTVMDAFLELDQRLIAHDSTLWVSSVPTRAHEKARRLKVWDEWVRDHKIHQTSDDAVGYFEAREQ
jgi:SulP family sulfate permease